MAYAHALIEYTDEDGNLVRISRGDEITSDTPGYEELVDGGSVKDDEYDPEAEPKLTPDYVEIDGVRYVKTGDGSEAEDVRS